jgi:hypothetical protein
MCGGKGTSQNFLSLVLLDPGKTIGRRLFIDYSLAYMETHLVLAKVVFNFNIELCPESSKRIVQDMYANWDKPPLWVRLNYVGLQTGLGLGILITNYVQFLHW